MRPLVGSFVREQALALARAGHDVHVAYIDQSKKPAVLVVSRGVRDGVAEYGISLPYPLHRLIGFYLPSVVAKTLRRILLEVKPDVVHAHAARPGGVIAAMAASGLSVPLVLTEHKGGVENYWYTRHGMRQVEEACCAYDRLYAVSRTFAEDLGRIFPTLRGKWRVCPNGIDTDAFRIEQGRRVPFSSGDVSLLFLGGAGLGKGVDVLIAAMRFLPASYVATIAGPGSDATMWGRIPSDIQARFRLVGEVQRSQVSSLMNSHDVLIVPSHYETFSLVCAEALACGTPVVASRCGGPEEIINEESGELFDVGDSFGLAKALQRLEGRSAKWSPERVRDRVVGEFSMDRLVARLSHAYRELLSG